MKIDVGKSWSEALGDYLRSDKMKQVTEFVQQQYSHGKTVHPEQSNVFAAFRTTSFNDIKVVILGQDPYHGPNQAMGLSFSVPKVTKNPPSLRNIFKELAAELGEPSQAEAKYGGDLTCWAKQGVLLLNAVLSVESGQPGSHSKKGWEDFTDHVIQTISDQKEQVVFLLWGNYAKNKATLIDSTKHLILTAPHPSPFSAYGGFFGCNHFIQTNQYLKKHQKQQVVW